MNKVCYTINFGDYDYVLPPKVITPGWDYICITDNPRTGTGWNMMPYDNDMPRWLIAREAYIKHNKFLPNYDLSIMIGGQFEVNCDLDEWIDNRISDSADMALPQHPQRFCVYREIDVCAEIGKITKEKRSELYKLFQRDGVPDELGLIQCNGLIRKHDREDLTKFTDLWFENTKITQRDQVSFMWTYWNHRIISYNLYSPKEFDRKFIDTSRSGRKPKKSRRTAI